MGYLLKFVQDLTNLRQYADNFVNLCIDNPFIAVLISVPLVLYLGYIGLSQFRQFVKSVLNMLNSQNGRIGIVCSVLISMLASSVLVPTIKQFKEPRPVIIMSNTVEGELAYQAFAANDFPQGTPPSEREERYALMVRAGEPKLIGHINEILKNLQEQGRLEALKQESIRSFGRVFGRRDPEASQFNGAESMLSGTHLGFPSQAYRHQRSGGQQSKPWRKT